MKKLILSTALAIGILSSHAENKAYFFTDMSGEFDQMGAVYCISPNGEYAVIYDDEMEQSFLWKRSNPSELQFINLRDGSKRLPTEVRAVKNDGAYVGSYRVGAQWHPFLQTAEGETINLPLTEWALTLNYPCAISDNGDIIGGMIGGKAYCLGNSTHGQSRPAFWVKGTDGEYEIQSFDDNQMKLPEHQGTFVMGMYSDGTLENSYLYGTCGAGIASYIPFVYHNGAMKFWNNIDHVYQPWYYKGQVKGYTWVETLDGMIDYENTEIMAGLYGCDRQGNLYGSRAIVCDIDSTIPVEDVAKYGKGTLKYRTGYYNVHTDQWTEIETSASKYFTVGSDGKVMFDSHGNIYKDGMEGASQSVGASTGVSFAGHAMNGVERMSEDGSVLGMSYSAMGDDGVPHNYAVIVTLDSPLSAIDLVSANKEKGHVVLTHGDNLEVIGAKHVEVYDLNGRRVASGAVSQPGRGVFIVVADGASYKVAL